MIKCKFKDLFDTGNKSAAIEINKGLASLFGFTAKNAGLNYDIKTRLLKSVNERIAEFSDSLTKLKESFSTEKEIEFKNGTKEKTYLKLIDVPVPDKKSKEKGKEIQNLIIAVNGKSVVTKESIGKMIDTTSYDIPAEKIDELTDRINELLETDIELNCFSIKLSKLNNEADTSSIAFEHLDLFINNDVD